MENQQEESEAKETEVKERPFQWHNIYIPTVLGAIVGYFIFKLFIER